MCFFQLPFHFGLARHDLVGEDCDSEVFMVDVRRCVFFNSSFSIDLLEVTLAEKDGKGKLIFSSKSRGHVVTAFTAALGDFIDVSFAFNWIFSTQLLNFMQIWLISAKLRGGILKKSMNFNLDTSS